MDIRRIFQLNSSEQFNELAIEIFHYQYQNNGVYREFCELLGTAAATVNTIDNIPFLPISFFKSRPIMCGTFPAEIVFHSSGTTGINTSKHYVKNTGLYEMSYTRAFNHFYGPVDDYCVLALLPSYMEQDASSLIYMVNDLIQKSGHPKSGFYLQNIDELKNVLVSLDALGTKVLLIGVSYALLDFVEKHTLTLKNTIVMETGGMKGRRREMVREELHDKLKKGFGTPNIHSEYGMTELLSQAYSKGKGLFFAPPWMRILIRDTEDPFTYQKQGSSGGVNIIDLANIYSCSFIATQDLGKMQIDGSFEILGRFDHADIRGCNLMAL